MAIFTRHGQEPQRDFARQYIERVNTLHRHLNMPVYGIFKVANNKKLRRVQELVNILQNSSSKELKSLKVFLKKQQAGKPGRGK